MKRYIKSATNESDIRSKIPGVILYISDTTARGGSSKAYPESNTSFSFGGSRYSLKCDGSVIHVLEDGFNIGDISVSSSDGYKEIADKFWEIYKNPSNQKPENYDWDRRFKGKFNDLSKSELGAIRDCAYWIIEGRKRGETLDSIVSYIKNRTIENRRSMYYNDNSFQQEIDTLESSLSSFATIEDLSKVARYLK